MRTRIFEVGLVAVLAVGATWALGPRAVSAGGTLFGAGDGGTMQETIQWSTMQSRALQANVQRAVIKVPKSYGEVVQILSDKDGGTVMWLRDGSGTLRNVVIPALPGVAVVRE